MLTRRARTLALALLMGTSILGGGVGSAEAACSTAEAGGGDWPSLNGDLSNTRNQVMEDTIGVNNVSLVQPAWSFTPQSLGQHTGQIQSTPVIAEGCVYITNSSGFAYALNADTGELVWAQRYEETVASVCCGGTLFAPAVVDGVLYLNVSHNPTTSSDSKGPYVLAADAHTGEVLWKTEHVAWEDGAYTNSSAVYVENGDHDVVIIGISNPEMEPNQTGGFALVDPTRECSAESADFCADPVPGATGGTILKRTRTIPDDQHARGMGGGSIWSTAAVDDDLYAYAGTGQPAGWFDAESEYVNAIIKFDVDATRDTFGEIVDVHKGTWDSELRGDAIPYIDVDFAASPTLYRDVNGDQMVAELQKSGWVHAAHTRHMSRAWSVPVSPYGYFLGNYASTATDGNGNVFAHGTYPGQIFSLNGTTGVPNWVTPAVTTVGANPVTYSNGVVYMPDGKGVLNAYDAATGAVLLQRPMAVDGGGVCLNAGGGVSIARNTIYAVCGDGSVTYQNGPNDEPSGYLIAYRLS